jgi:hypothetical protein
VAKRVPDGLAEVEVLDEEGRAHQVGELWRRNVAVILFVRHFG